MACWKMMGVFAGIGAEEPRICDRSGSSVDERFAGWKASPSCWKDAGEAEWWRHGRCGQVARKDAAGRSPVHPFAPSRPLASGYPPRQRSPHVCTRRYSRIHGYTHTYVDPSRISLPLFSSCRPSPILFFSCISVFLSPFPPPVELSPL